MIRNSRMITYSFDCIWTISKIFPTYIAYLMVFINWFLMGNRIMVDCLIYCIVMDGMGFRWDVYGRILLNPIMFMRSLSRSRCGGWSLSWSSSRCRGTWLLGWSRR